MYVYYIYIYLILKVGSGTQNRYGTLWKNQGRNEVMLVVFSLMIVFCSRKILYSSVVAYKMFLLTQIIDLTYGSRVQALVTTGGVRKFQKPPMLWKGCQRYLFFRNLNKPGTLENASGFYPCTVLLKLERISVETCCSWRE